MDKKKREWRGRVWGVRRCGALRCKMGWLPYWLLLTDGVMNCVGERAKYFSLWHR